VLIIKRLTVKVRYTLKVRYTIKEQRQTVEYKQSAVLESIGTGILFYNLQILPKHYQNPGLSCFTLFIFGFG